MVVELVGGSAESEFPSTVIASDGGLVSMVTTSFLATTTFPLVSATPDWRVFVVATGFALVTELFSVEFVAMVTKVPTFGSSDWLMSILFVGILLLTITTSPVIPSCDWSVLLALVTMAFVSP